MKLLFVVLLCSSGCYVEKTTADATSASGAESSGPTFEMDRVAAGQKIWSTQCSSCHSDGGSMAPSWRGMWGSTREFTDGSSTRADEAYIRQSIKNPTSQVVKGYAPTMSSKNLSDSEIDSVIAFIKSLR